jgi:N-acetylglucosamine-6-sulfatase
MNNLVRDSAFRKIGLQLKDELFKWLKETNGLQIPLKKTINNRNDNLFRGTY